MLAFSENKKREKISKIVRLDPHDTDRAKAWYLLEGFWIDHEGLLSLYDVLWYKLCRSKNTGDENSCLVGYYDSGGNAGLVLKFFFIYINKDKNVFVFLSYLFQIIGVLKIKKLLGLLWSLFKFEKVIWTSQPWPCVLKNRNHFPKIAEKFSF